MRAGEPGDFLVLVHASPEIKHMTQTSYLSGKVIKHSLAKFDPRPAADAPKLKRLMLQQGELAQVHDGEPAIRYLAYIELVNGAIRGNLFHKEKNEFLYIIRGRIELVVEDSSDGQCESMPLESGDLVFIPVPIAHAFRTVEPGHAIEFSSSAYDRADVYPFAIIKAEKV
ncbi:MAG: cupin domain-containing protein [Limisphaerales bacterium]